jgi:hypothetical protein
MTAVFDRIGRVVAPFKAQPKQQLAAKHWRTPGVRVVLIGGAIRSGKTQAGGRLVVETAVEQPATYLVARSTYISASLSQPTLPHGVTPSPRCAPRLVQSMRSRCPR